MAGRDQRQLMLVGRGRHHLSVWVRTVAMCAVDP